MPVDEHLQAHFISAYVLVYKLLITNNWLPHGKIVLASSDVELSLIGGLFLNNFVLWFRLTSTKIQSVFIYSKKNIKKI
jgi:hypothetical protein